EMRFFDGRKAAVQSAYINKADILFLRETEDGQTRGLGGKAGHKPYPFVPKTSTMVRLYMPSYTLSGKMHYPGGRGVSDVLNSGLRFIPLTNVEICPGAGNSESGVGFIAVNREQMLSLTELHGGLCQAGRAPGIPNSLEGPLPQVASRRQLTLG
ncbi:unnamed protein product, partial [marine sediment metagenome]